MAVGHHIFYDLRTGEVLFISPEISNGVGNTPEEDINNYDFLRNRDQTTFDYIELAYGQYVRDFAECNGVRVNLETLALEFSYPDPNEPEQPPVYRKSLAEENEELREQLAATNRDLQDIAEFVFGA